MRRRGARANVTGRRTGLWLWAVVATAGCVALGAVALVPSQRRVVTIREFPAQVVAEEYDGQDVCVLDLSTKSPSPICDTASIGGAPPRRDHFSWDVEQMIYYPNGQKTGNMVLFPRGAFDRSSNLGPPIPFSIPRGAPIMPVK